MKPKAETSAGWSSWKKQARKSHPIRYWIAEEGLDIVQNTIYWPIDRLYDAKYYINNRWVTKTHALTSSSLAKGQWHEYETRVLHCLFDELVNFVEVEQAWSHILWDNEAKKKYRAPFWARGWFRTRTWRCPEAGLDYLKWASGLTFGEHWGVEPGSEKYGQPTPQALAAREIMELYEWWTKIRPLRPDPYEASGWSDICSRQRKSDPDNIFGETNTEEERVESHRALDIIQEMEESYERQDEEMMIRLIKVSKSMWT